jgi:hypothetical protein
LLERGQYTEALCAVQAFDQTEHRTALTRSLREALDPAIHLHGVSKEELSALIGDRAERLLERAVVLRTRHDSRMVNLERFELATALSTPGRETEPLPLTLETLADLTQEVLPEAQTVEYGPSKPRQIADAAQNVGHVGASLIELLTLGVIPLSKLVPAAPHRASGSHTIDPTKSELVEAAPVAARVQAALDSRGYQGDPGITYDSFAVWRRPPRGAPVKLTIVSRYSGYSPEGDCELIDGIEIGLSPNQTIEQSIRSLFGNRMRRLSELR